MKKKARALLLALALCLLVPLPASANGVEPPYLTIWWRIPRRTYS